MVLEGPGGQYRECLAMSSKVGSTIDFNAWITISAHRRGIIVVIVVGWDIQRWFCTGCTMWLRETPVVTIATREWEGLTSSQVGGDIIEQRLAVLLTIGGNGRSFSSQNRP